MFKKAVTAALVLLPVLGAAQCGQFAGIAPISATVPMGVAGSPSSVAVFCGSQSGYGFVPSLEGTVFVDMHRAYGTSRQFAFSWTCPSNGDRQPPNNIWLSPGAGNATWDCTPGTRGNKKVYTLVNGLAELEVNSNSDTPNSMAKVGLEASGWCDDSSKVPVQVSGVLLNGITKGSQELSVVQLYLKGTAFC